MKILYTLSYCCKTTHSYLCIVSSMSDFYVVPEASVPKALHAALTDEDKMLSAASVGGKFSVDPADERVDDDSHPWNDCTMKDVVNVDLYRHLFNVDQQFVVSQLKRAALPRPNEPVLLPNTKPDMYGPVWIGATLVVCIAVMSNIASYVYFSTSLADKSAWHYDFHTVSIASTYVLLYLTLVPVSVYMAIHQLAVAESKQEDEIATFGGPQPMARSRPVTLVHTVALFGYSLVNFLPCSIALIVPHRVVQWLIVVATSVLASATAIFSLHKPLTTGRLTWDQDGLDVEDLPQTNMSMLSTLTSDRKILLIYLAIFGVNFGLAFILMFSFYTFDNVV